MFLWPRPGEDDLKDYYSDKYRTEHEGETSPVKSYRRGVAPARARVERLLPHLPSDSSVLEIGSSTGHFLEAVRPHVRHVTGVEPGLAHRNWCRAELDLDTYASLDELQGRSFDLIALFHTLEHLQDPVQSLRNLRQYLAPDGLVVVEVPNVDDALVKLYDVPSFLESYFQRPHLYYFSASTLERAARAAGGAVEVSGIQRYDLSNHIRWLVAGEGGGQGYYSHVFTEPLQAAYSEALARAGLSDTLWGLVRFD